VTAQLTAHVIGQQVKEAAVIDGTRGTSRIEVFEVEVLDLGRDEEVVALAVGVI